MENTLCRWQKSVEREILAFCRKFPEYPSRLYQPVRYVMMQGGKRLRPVLLLMSCKIFRDDVAPAIPAALAVELFHNFTLVHDDIMDCATLRRNQPAVHHKWGQSTAILSGDAMLVYAYRLMESLPAEVKARVLPIFNWAATEVCEGQQMDMDYEKRARVSVKEYFRMIEKKTASLIAASLRMGAVCGGAPEVDCRRLAGFGRHFGIAFQLMDDVLDVYGDPRKTGKKTGADISANKKTFLLVKAIEVARGNLRKELVAMVSAKQKGSHAHKIEKVRGIYNRLSLRQPAEVLIRQHQAKAMELLGEVHADDNKKDELCALAKGLIEREN